MQSFYQSIKIPGCGGMCCKEFFRIERITTAPMPDLTNELHPLFAQGKFAMFYNELTSPSILSHALQLASNLLEASLPFWHSIMLADIRPLAELENIGAGEVQYEIFDEVKHTAKRPETLTSRQQHETRLRLHQLAEYVTYAIWSDSDDAHDERNDGGAVTDNTYFINRNKCLLERSYFWTGKASQISLHPAILISLQRYQHGTDLVAYHWAAFHLAVTLCHELAHAACAARRPQVVGYCGKLWDQESNGNLFFKGSDVAEPGYEWEARTFGGLITRLRTTPENHLRGQPVPPLYQVNGIDTAMSGMLVVRQWLAPDMVTLYKRMNGQTGLREKNSVAEKEKYWNFSFGNIHRLFQQEFWNLDTHRRPGALWPLRLVSFVPRPPPPGIRR
ncbi:hypothetical protein Slin15195_G103140 [Septoria linicola]|uniref:Uncharacterized protein n=1 Tax=Septoria linicola TaxID=215465 RepID=A0A9Q9B2H7_9PEZI|nr:hypothetical protein Slin15195_G103140 [Septoria linicola]